MADTKFSPVPVAERPPDDPPRGEDALCGVGGFRPRWLQRFADPKAYLVLFCLVGVVEGAYFTYYVGVLSTLEKRFAFESKVSGLILIAENLSAAVISLLAGFYGTGGHKPRMVAFGMMLVGLTSYLSALPYFLYGPGLHLLSRDLSSLGIQKDNQEYCDPEEERECGAQGASEGGAATAPAVTILFMAKLINGFGYAAYYTIGAPYLDDNVKKKNSPMYMSAMAALRVFGPVLGFLLSSFCLKIYEDPFYDPGIDPNNPRWVGAWWMGFLILGSILLFLSFLLVLFPKQLPERFRSERKKGGKEEEKMTLPKLKEFPQAARRLLRNPILVCHVVSVTFQVNGFIGYFVFMPKFLEAQYGQSASDASLFSGVTGILSLLIGILLGGMVIMKYKPRPRYLTGYMVLVEIMSVVGLFISIFLGCDQMLMPGTTSNEDSTLNLFNECNAGCGCTQKVFEPVCGEDGLSTYFSPCFAGCPNLTAVATTAAVSALSSGTSSAQLLESCKCTGGWNSTFTTSTVTSGFCKSTCNMFLVYIILLCISKFISATARVGNTLIMFRCVEAKDKSFAMGVFGSVLALFAFIPYPLIYGALTDSACLVWEQSCGRTGNCWLYDTGKFRNYLHGMSMLFISIGICFDGVVFLLSDRLKGFYGDEHQAAAGGARWPNEDEDEDVGFASLAKRGSIVEVDPVF